MASFVKFQCFAPDLAKGVHNLQTGQVVLRVALTNTAPNVSANTVLANITQISYTNITETLPADTQMTATTNPAGTWQVSGVDITLNATGAVAAFRYVVLYNDTQTSPNKPLIGYWDYGSSVALANGESFTIDFNPIMFTVT